MIRSDEGKLTVSIARAIDRFTSKAGLSGDPERLSLIRSFTPLSNQQSTAAISGKRKPYDLIKFVSDSQLILFEIKLCDSKGQALMQANWDEEQFSHLTAFRKAGVPIDYCYGHDAFHNLPETDELTHRILEHCRVSAPNTLFEQPRAGESLTLESPHASLRSFLEKKRSSTSVGGVLLSVLIDEEVIDELSNITSGLLLVAFNEPLGESLVLQELDLKGIARCYKSLQKLEKAEFASQLAEAKRIIASYRNELQAAQPPVDDIDKTSPRPGWPF